MTEAVELATPEVPVVEEVATPTPNLNTEINSRNFAYIIRRVEGAAVTPCELCMGGYDAPWHIAFFVGGDPNAEGVPEGATQAMVICAADAVDITRLTDLCSDCIPDATGERTCDVCGKEFRRKKVTSGQ